MIFRKLWEIIHPTFSNSCMRSRPCDCSRNWRMPRPRPLGHWLVTCITQKCLGWGMWVIRSWLIWLCSGSRTRPGWRRRRFTSRADGEVNVAHAKADVLVSVSELDVVKNDAKGEKGVWFCCHSILGCFAALALLSDYITLCRFLLSFHVRISSSNKFKRNKESRLMPEMICALGIEVEAGIALSLHACNTMYHYDNNLWMLC